MSDAVIGTEVDGYRIESVLGRGGMGTVYKAEDVNLSRTVAIKRINPGQQERESFIHRFRSEAQALARIDSPNIVGVYALRDTDIGLLIVMEYVEGGTLKDPIDNHGAIDPSQAVPILEQTLEAFHDAHSAGVIHRDIKPENVMLTRDGMVKVTDFGIAKLRQPDSGETVTQGGQGGTLKYMSPEQISNISAVDARSDIYSLGMTAYEMLSGSLPFKSSDTDFDIMRKVVEGEIPPPDEFAPELPSGLAQWVMGAIQKQQDDRYQTVEAMLEALREADQQVDHTMTQPDWEVGGDSTESGPTRTVVADDEDDADRTQTVVPGDDEAASSEPGGGTVLDDGPVEDGEATQPAVPGPDPEPAVEGADEDDTQIDPAPDPAPAGDPPGTAPDASSDQDRHGLSWAGVAGGLAGLVLFAVGGYVAALQLGGDDSAPAPATLSLTTTPAGATVLVNGDTAGTTPVTGYAFEAGVAQLEVRSNGETALDTTLQAAAGAQVTLQGISVGVPSADGEGGESGTASAQADPNGAESPSTGDRAPAAEPEQRPRTTDAASAREAAPSADPDQEPATPESSSRPRGTVTVTPKPAGTVLIDGEERGGGSAEVPVGEHTVTCRHPDHGTTQTTVTVAEGQTQTLTCYFTQRVSVNTTGAYGRIWLNGQDTGRNTNAAQPLSLPPGTHRIEVRRRSISNFQVDGGRVKVERGTESETKRFTGSAYSIQVTPSFRKVEHAVVFNVSAP
jgi:serine/threonine protein kinase